MQEGRAWRPLAAALFIASGAASGPAALAHEAHTHQHGAATLELSQEADTLVIAFRSPLDSLVGFETRPANASQQKQMARLREQLKGVGPIVKLPAAAGCTQQEMDIDSPEWLETGHDDDHDHRHADKGATGHARPGRDARGDSTSQDVHDEHDADDDHAHEHADGADHDNDGHEHEGHADLAVRYTLRCSHVDALKTLTVSAFGTWPRLRQIDVAAVNDRGQKAVRLTPKQRSLNW